MLWGSKSSMLGLEPGVWNGLWENCRDAQRWMGATPVGSHGGEWYRTSGQEDEEHRAEVKRNARRLPFLSPVSSFWKARVNGGKTTSLPRLRMRPCCQKMTPSIGAPGHSSTLKLQTSAGLHPWRSLLPRQSRRWTCWTWMSEAQVSTGPYPLWFCVVGWSAFLHLLRCPCQLQQTLNGLEEMNFWEIESCRTWGSEVDWLLSG